MDELYNLLQTLVTHGLISAKPSSIPYPSAILMPSTMPYAAPIPSVVSRPSVIRSLSDKSNILSPDASNNSTTSPFLSTTSGFNIADSHFSPSLWS